MTKIDKNKIIENLKEVGGHVGYSRPKRHSSVKGMIYGSKNGRDIIDLEQTAEQIEKAAAFVEDLVKSKKQILFVGVKPEAKEKVRNSGMVANMPYAAERFIGGSLTNFGEIKRRIEKLVDFTQKKEKGEFAVYTKKEQVLLDREIGRMTKNFGGLVGITGIPAALVVVDPRAEEIAVTEAKYMRIPVVALSNTDCNISKIAYPIVMNEASSGAVGIVLDILAQAAKDGANAEA